MNLLLVAMLACSTPEAPAAPDLRTDPARYEALSHDAPRLADGQHGQVSVWARHTFDHDAAAEPTAFVTTGPAVLVVRGGILYAVAPRHLVVPEPQTRSVGEVSIGAVRATRSELRVGSLAFAPEAVRFLPDQDLAALRIAPGDRQALVDLPREADPAPLDPALLDAVFGAGAVEVRIPGQGTHLDTPVSFGAPAPAR